MSHAILFRSLVVTIAQSNVAQRLSNSRIKTSQVEIHIPSSNSSSVYFGDGNVSSSNAVPRAVGSTQVFNASEHGDITRGDYFDLSKLYLTSATAGDSVIIQYTDTVGESDL